MCAGVCVAAADAQTFVNGVNGYSGTEDIVISNLYGGNGTVFATEKNPLYQRSSGNEFRALLRFGGLSLPPGYVVESASVSIGVNTWTTGFRIQGFYVASDWTAAVPGIGWLRRSGTTLNWASVGAGAADRLPGKTVEFSGFRATGDQAVTAALDAAIVQSWIDNPAGNHGVVLVNDTVEKIASIYSYRTSNSLLRPALTIVARPASTIPPAPVTVTSAPALTITDAYGDSGPALRDPRTQVAYYSWGSHYVELLKFPLPPTPPGYKIASASLRLGFNTWETGMSLNGYYLRTPWEGGSAKLGWRRSGETSLWASPGAGAADRLAAPTFRFSGYAAKGDQAMAVALDAEVVQRWASSPSTNHGILLENDTMGKQVLVHSERSTAVSLRPALTVTYSPAGPEETPAVSMLTPAAGQLLTGDATLTAAAVGSVASVEYQIDGVATGARLTAPPYSLRMDTRAVANGTHTIVAIARNAAGAIGASASITVAVENNVPVPTSTFFAPPQLSGSFAVKLYATEGIAAGQTRLVTFGVPFARSSLTAAELGTVKVLRNGIEIPAFVEILTPWRHLANAAVNGTSARVVRIQVEHTVTTPYPGYDTLTVEWGFSSRTANRPFRNPRESWHPVTTNGWTAADGISEPDVYAVLPAAVLCNGVLPGARMVPFDASVAETRDDPAAIKARTSWPGWTKLQTSIKNFGYTILNEDGPYVTSAYLVPYKTASEPWLYDRASALYMWYFQSSAFGALRAAVQNSQFYMKNLYRDSGATAAAAGIFRLVSPDPTKYIGATHAMYSYNENLAYTYWLTGDDTAAPSIRWVAGAHAAWNDTPARWSPGAAQWNERHSGFRLLASTVAYEVFGDAAYASQVQTYTADFIWHQNGAGGQLPAGRVDGGLYHYTQQHPDGPTGVLVASPWMSVLLANAMVRTYGVTEAPATAHFLRRMGTFLKAATKTDANHLYGGSLAYADYLTGVAGNSVMREGNEVEHALEVGASLAWSNFFANELSTPDVTLRSVAQQLMDTHLTGVNYWTRPANPDLGAPAYRVNPPRKYGWQHRTSASVPWLLP